MHGAGVAGPPILRASFDVRITNGMVSCRTAPSFGIEICHSERIWSSMDSNSSSTLSTSSISSVHGRSYRRARSNGPWTKKSSVCRRVRSIPSLFQSDWTAFRGTAFGAPYRPGRSPSSHRWRDKTAFQTTSCEASFRKEARTSKPPGISATDAGSGAETPGCCSQGSATRSILRLIPQFGELHYCRSSCSCSSSLATPEIVPLNFPVAVKKTGVGGLVESSNETGTAVSVNLSMPDASLKRPLPPVI